MDTPHRPPPLPETHPAAATRFLLRQQHSNNTEDLRPLHHYYKTSAIHSLAAQIQRPINSTQLTNGRTRVSFPTTTKTHTSHRDDRDTRLLKNNPTNYNNKENLYSPPDSLPETGNKKQYLPEQYTDRPDHLVKETISPPSETRHPTCQATPYQFVPPAARNCFLWDNTPTGPTCTVSPRNLAPSSIVIQPTALQALEKNVFLEKSQTTQHAGFFIAHTLLVPETPSERLVASNTENLRSPTLVIDRFDPGRELGIKLDLDHENAHVSKKEGWMKKPTILMDGDLEVRVYRADQESSTSSQSLNRQIYLFLAQLFTNVNSAQSPTSLTALSPLAMRCQKTEKGITVDCRILVPAIPIKLTPIRPLRLVMTTLASDLLSVTRGFDGDYGKNTALDDCGFLTIDKSRHVLLLLASDPKASELPLVGIWFAGASAPTDSRLTAWLCNFVLKARNRTLDSEPSAMSSTGLRIGETVKKGQCCLVVCFASLEQNFSAGRSRGGQYGARSYGAPVVPKYWEATWDAAEDSSLELPCELLGANASIDFPFPAGNPTTTHPEKASSALAQGDQIEGNVDCSGKHEQDFMEPCGMKLIPRPIDLESEPDFWNVAKEVWHVRPPSTIERHPEGSISNDVERPPSNDPSDETPPLSTDENGEKHLLTEKDNAPSSDQRSLFATTNPSPSAFPHYFFPYLYPPQPPVSGNATPGPSHLPTATPPAELLLLQQQAYLTYLQQQIDALRGQLSGHTVADRREESAKKDVSHEGKRDSTESEVLYQEVGTNTTFVYPPVGEYREGRKIRDPPRTVDSGCNTTFLSVSPYPPPAPPRTETRKHVDAASESNGEEKEDEDLGPGALSTGTFEEHGTLGTFVTRDLYGPDVKFRGESRRVPSTDGEGMMNGSEAEEMGDGIVPPTGTYRPLYEAGSEVVGYSVEGEDGKRGVPGNGAFLSSMASSAAAAERTPRDWRDDRVGRGAKHLTRTGLPTREREDEDEGRRVPERAAVPETEMTFFDEESFRKLVRGDGDDDRGEPEDVEGEEEEQEEKEDQNEDEPEEGNREEISQRKSWLGSESQDDEYNPEISLITRKYISHLDPATLESALGRAPTMHTQHMKYLQSEGSTCSTTTSGCSSVLYRKEEGEGKEKKEGMSLGTREYLIKFGLI